MTTRAPRPTDLVALVTFDEDVRENLAVTRERLAQGNGAPTPLAAAFAQWLHLGRRTWVSIAGRQIRGIATARDVVEAQQGQHGQLVGPAGFIGGEHGAEILHHRLGSAAGAAGEEHESGGPAGGQRAEQCVRGGLIHPRQQVPAEAIGGDDPLDIDLSQFGGVLGGVTR